MHLTIKQPKRQTHLRADCPADQGGHPLGGAFGRGRPSLPAAAGQGTAHQRHHHQARPTKSWSGRDFSAPWPERVALWRERTRTSSGRNSCARWRATCSRRCRPPSWPAWRRGSSWTPPLCSGRRADPLPSPQPQSQQAGNPGLGGPPRPWGAPRPLPPQGEGSPPSGEGGDREAPRGSPRRPAALGPKPAHHFKKEIVTWNTHWNCTAFANNTPALPWAPWTSLCPWAPSWGLLGRTARGKSTTIKAALGLVRPDGGSVRLLGKDPEQDRSVLSQVGVGAGRRDLPPGDERAPAQPDAVRRLPQLGPGGLLPPPGALSDPLGQEGEGLLPGHGHEVLPGRRHVLRGQAAAPGRSHLRPGPHRPGRHPGHPLRLHPGRGAQRVPVLPHHRGPGKDRRLHRLPPPGADPDGGGRKTPCCRLTGCSTAPRNS